MYSVFVQPDTIQNTKMEEHMLRLYDEREPGFEIFGLEEIKKYLGEGYEECTDVFDINEKLNIENDGMAGYKCEELEEV